MDEQKEEEPQEKSSVPEAIIDLHPDLKKERPKKDNPPSEPLPEKET